MTTIATEPGSGHGDDHGHDHPHDHPKFLAHHFETPQQQFDSGKLGVWLFLTTEILLFSGLFCAYSVYRANHPEVFAYAHLYLNKTYGAINTVVLIFSSFTMAWAVRASQLGQRKLCMTLLSITIACGVVFMCIKGVEYHDKWREHILMPGPHDTWYNPTEAPTEPKESRAQEAISADIRSRDKVAGEAALETPTPAGAGVAAAPASAPAISFTGPATRLSPEGVLVEQSVVPKAQIGPGGVSPQWNAAHEPWIEKSAQEAGGEGAGPEPYNTHIFFSIYFLMTGLHGVHVLAGMGARSSGC